jgi:hypothetical protein
MGKKSESGSGIRIRDVQPKSYFRELKKQLFGFKYLNSLMWIRYPRDKGWKIRIRIRDGKRSYPGSGINIKNPQHWKNLAALGTRSFVGAKWTPVS